MRIAIDAMGGDKAPGETVKGALEAREELGIEPILIGPEEKLREELSRLPQSSSGNPPRIAECYEIIGMSEKPTSAVRRKPNSSISVGLELLKRGEADAFVSAGNTGAIVVASLLILGKFRGLRRPALATRFLSPSGPVLFLDVGANAECRPEFLLQFALLGSFYMNRIFDIHRPRVALLSSGEEEGKGNKLVIGAFSLLKESPLNFIGNIESKDIPLGVADVVVTDGFTGNVVIKLSEGLGKLFLDLLRKTLEEQSLPSSLIPLLLRKAELNLAEYMELRGGLLLGVRGNVVIAHGRSDARAIKNAVRIAKQAAEFNLSQVLEEAWEEMKFDFRGRGR